MDVKVTVLLPNQEMCIATSPSKRYRFRNENGNLVIVSWFEPLLDSRGWRFELREPKIGASIAAPTVDKGV